MLELVCLGEISRDAVYEFAFIGGSLKLRGGGCSTNEAHRYPCVLTQLADVDLDHRGLVYASDRSGESCAGQGPSRVETELFVFECTAATKEINHEICGRFSYTLRSDFARFIPP